VIPLHAMEANGVRGGIVPTHSQPRHRWGWVVSVTPKPRFTPGERTSGTHCTGGWVGPRAGLDAEARGKIPCRGSNPDRPARSQTLFCLSYHDSSFKLQLQSIYIYIPTELPSYLSIIIDTYLPNKLRLQAYSYLPNHKRSLSAEQHTYLLA
jgi:hypothetical protein